MAEINCPICAQIRIVAYGHHRGYSLCRCRDCSLIFVHPLPADPAAIYQKNYFQKEPAENFAFGYTDYDQDKEPMREVFIRQIRWFEDLTSGRQIFDIGAATGYFLNLARERGWQTAGIELSDFAADQARRRGHNVMAGLLPEKSLTPDYDVVTMWDVFEHVDKPNSYIKKAHELLKPGGYLAINTPDASSWWARLMGKHWHLMVPPEHLYYYSPKNLRLVLEQNGFRIVKFKKIGKRFSLPYFFKTGYEWQKLKLWKVLWHFFDKDFWRRLSIPFNLRDNIFVLAQKK